MRIPTFFSPADGFAFFSVLAFPCGCFGAAAFPTAPLGFAGKLALGEAFPLGGFGTSFGGAYSDIGFIEVE
jgi:hypothetical protein